MPSAAYYRREAELAREKAVNSKDPEASLRWLKIAKDYRTLADAFEGRGPAPPPPSGPMQRQPMQQQQRKLGTDDPAVIDLRLSVCSRLG